MSKIALASDPSGTGTFTIASPNSNTNRTLTLPDTSGEVFNQGNIVGTVSQSSGVPTGAIIERGSNANGEFIKCADGTLICFENRSVTPVANTYTSFSWTYPSAFSVAPVISVTANSAQATLKNTQFSNSTTTSADIGIVRETATATTLSAIAIGVWY
jgi:hypothetical protein